MRERMKKRALASHMFSPSLPPSLPPFRVFPFTYPSLPSSLLPSGLAPSLWRCASLSGRGPYG